MKEEKGLSVKSESSIEVQTIDLSGSIPSLKDAEELPIDLCGNYWTPEMPGEFKNLIFIEIKPQKVLSAQGTGELIDLDCAVFAEQNENGDLSTIMNGSRRLVGILEPFVSEGKIKNGTLLKVTFMGKRKNKTNSYSSDNWSIKLLRINLSAAG